MQLFGWRAGLEAELLKALVTYSVTESWRQEGDSSRPHVLPDLPRPLSSHIGQAPGEVGEEEKTYKKRSQRAWALLSSSLWVGVLSCLEDVFSCYFLSKIEL